MYDMSRVAGNGYFDAEDNEEARHQMRLAVNDQRTRDYLSGDVCKWIENSFPEEIIVAPRAVSEMRKYSGALDIFSLCDGIAYLAEYARYRQQKLSADELELFAEYGGWDIQGCGKEALKMFRTEYTVTVGGKQYILDQHIKHGNKSKDLIRIYFCWDAELGKIIIGSMPEHLATVRNAP